MGIIFRLLKIVVGSSASDINRSSKDLKQIVRNSEEAVQLGDIHRRVKKQGRVRSESDANCHLSSQMLPDADSRIYPFLPVLIMVSKILPSQYTVHNNPPIEQGIL